MLVNTIKENLCVNKLVASKKEIVFVEGDMIIPDSKPDILDTICTSGVICLYKKEVIDDKVKLDGSINTYIMYLADDEKDKVRGLNTSLDFSENINITNCIQGMDCKLDTKIKSIETKILNGRKISIKATIEVDIKIYSKEDIEIINNLENTDEIKILKEQLKVNSLVGNGQNKIYVKDNISIDTADNLAELLSVNTHICDKDIKISYNKILAKAEAEIKMIYLTEDNRINKITSKIPVVGFIDIPNVSEDNLCNINYEIKNIIIKPNQAEEHSIYVEIEIEVIATVYEEKEINLIQDLYSPCSKLEFNRKQVNTMTDKRQIKESKQIREKVNIENLNDKNVIDINATPTIIREKKENDKISYEGELELQFLLADNEANVETRNLKIPFEHKIENIGNSENISTDVELEIANQDFIVQDGGNVTSNVDLLIDTNMYRNAKLNIMDQIETTGAIEDEDYSLIIYIVKEGDTLWNIAKKFGSTVEDIVRTNGIEDENKIYPNQKLFIPKYKRKGISSENAPMITYG